MWIVLFRPASCLLNNNNKENVFSNETHEESSLELNEINDNLIVYIGNNKFNNIDNESISEILLMTH